MNLKIYQKFYTKCLFIDNKIQNYIEAYDNFKKICPNIKFILNEYETTKIKSIIGGGINNLSLEELCLN